MIIHNFALNFLLFFLRLSLFYNFIAIVGKCFHALNFVCLLFSIFCLLSKVLSYFSVCLPRLFNDVVLKCVARVLLLLFTPHNTSYYHYYYIKNVYNNNKSKEIRKL